eukprot:Colp12_sorted_trinity150504_noHs@552
MAPKSLLIFYGWPSTYNKLNGNIDKLVAAYSEYDYIVFGGGIEQPTHGDHNNTKTIISRLVPKGVFIFGYVDLGVSTLNYSLSEINKRAGLWKDMGVQGIFLDDFGFDFKVTRDRQNTAVDAVHSYGLKVCANAWNSADVFTPSNGVRPKLIAGDFSLVESYVISVGQKTDPTVHANRMATMRSQMSANGFTGVNLLGVTTASPTSVYDQATMDYVEAQATKDALTAVGFGAYNFGTGASKIAPPDYVSLDLPAYTPYETKEEKQSLTKAPVEVVYVQVPSKPSYAIQLSIVFLLCALISLAILFCWHP